MSTQQPIANESQRVESAQQTNKKQVNEFGEDEINFKLENHFVEDPKFQDFDKFDSSEENESQNEEDREKAAKDLFKVFEQEKLSKSNEKQKSQNVMTTPSKEEQIDLSIVESKHKKIAEDSPAKQTQINSKESPIKNQKVSSASNNNSPNTQKVSSQRSAQNIENADLKSKTGVDDIKKIPTSKLLMYKNSSTVIQVPEQFTIKHTQQMLMPQPTPQDLMKQSTKVIKQAQQQRMFSTYKIFKQYKQAYSKNVESYKLIISNIAYELTNKKQMKKVLSQNLKAYFITCSQINKQFHQKSYKIQKQQSYKSSNKFINMKQELKDGYEGFMYIRKAVADEQKKLQTLINTSIVKGITHHFQRYSSMLKVAENIFNEIKANFIKKQTNLNSLLTDMDQIFRKSLKGKHKQDIFTWIIKYLKQQGEYRKQLIKYGKSITQLRHAYIINEKQLFNNIQEVINQFKTQSSKLYSYKQKFTFIENYINIIEEENRYEVLCTITDLDYIKSVLELHGKKENIKFNDKHFLMYLELPFFDKFVGDIKEIFRSSIFKSFPLSQKNSFMVHTVSGNLVQFNQEKYQCFDRFNMENIEIKMVNEEGMLQIEQSSKTFIFNSVRKVVLQMVDGDKAEELLYYFNEKNQFKRNDKNDKNDNEKNEGKNEEKRT